jgi:hypothetical protein
MDYGYNGGYNSANTMSTTDWRWASQKGYWDPQRRCWNEDMGGMAAYIHQRNQRRDARKKRERGNATEGREFGINPKQRKTSSKSSTVVGILKNPATLLLGAAGEFRNNPLLALMLQNNWGHHVVRRFWTIGYQVQPIVDMFNELPAGLQTALGEAMAAAQRFANTCKFAVPSCPDENNNMDVVEWEEDSTHAFIVATFHPLNQRRTAISANSRAAALLGMHREELLARYAQHDVPLALPPLDGAALVCTQTVRVFDARRRICQVREARPAPAATAPLPARSVLPPP